MDLNLKIFFGGTGRDMDFRMKRILRFEYFGVIFAVIFFVFFNFLPRCGEISRLSRQIHQARSAVKTMTKAEKAKQIKQLEAERTRIQEGADFIKKTTEKVKASVPAEKNVPMVTLEIEDLAVASKIELTSIKPASMSDEEEEAEYKIYPIEIGFQSTYPQLVAFIGAIESSPSLMAVQNLKIQKDEMSYPLLDVRLTICVILKQEKTSVKVENVDSET